MILKQINIYFLIYTVVPDLQTTLLLCHSAESPEINVTNSKSSGQLSDLFSLCSPVCSNPVSGARMFPLLSWLLLVCLRAHPQLSVLLLALTPLDISCNHLIFSLCLVQIRFYFLQTKIHHKK